MQWIWQSKSNLKKDAFDIQSFLSFNRDARIISVFVKANSCKANKQWFRSRNNLSLIEHTRWEKNQLKGFFNCGKYLRLTFSQTIMKITNLVYKYLSPCYFYSPSSIISPTQRKGHCQRIPRLLTNHTRLSYTNLENLNTLEPRVGG